MHLSEKSVKPVDTPCTIYLPMDEDGQLDHGDFNYPSVIGQLNYLQGHSSSDITLDTSQVARFVHSPKHSHKLAVICIVHYLKGTINEGILLHPTRGEDFFKTDVYVDASFACSWGTELGTNTNSVKSRSRYIIKISNCLVLWVSNM